MKRLLYLAIFISIILASCEKSKFLDVLPSDGLVIPKTIKDAQALLDFNSTMNGNSTSGPMPYLGEAGADDYYVIANGTFVTEFVEPFYKNIYTWNDDPYYDNSLFPGDWQIGYRSILYANMALDVINKVSPKPEEVTAYNNVKGSGLFFRANMFYQLAQIFAPQYDKSISGSQLGIPLKLTPDVSETVRRSTLQETYDKIISDLKEALPLLPDLSSYLTRPTKAAVRGLLARVYLTMGDYEKALQEANACLQLKSALLDFNPPAIPNPNATFPLPQAINNPEIIFYSTMNSNNMVEFLGRYNGRIDSNLLVSYDINDLRRTVFFRDAAYIGRAGDRGSHFRGSYNKSAGFFTGIATDEIFLIRAECNARLGNTQLAMDDLNTLLKKRWKNTVTYTNLTASNSQEALTIVLRERRKELVMRGLRWIDLRRLNKEGANITITRKVLGQTYTLPPNDPRYVQLIPPQVIQFNPDMQQNPR